MKLQGCYFSGSCPPENPDTPLFKQLLDNAIEAVDERRAGERLLRIRTQASPDHIEVTFEDTGPGIPAEWRYKVFEPFFTTKGADHRHLGMGLSMVQEAVTRHGGLIDFDPSYRDGCRVRVQLPRTGGEQHA